LKTKQVIKPSIIQDVYRAGQGKLKKPHTFRFSDEIDKLASKEATTKTKAFENGVLCLAALRVQTLREIQDYFTKDELLSLLKAQKLDTYSTTLLQSSKVYNAYLEECYIQDRTLFHDIKKLVNKISKLTCAQVYFLRLQILSYHQEKGKGVKEIFFHLSTKF